MWRGVEGSRDRCCPRWYKQVDADKGLARLAQRLRTQQWDHRTDGLRVRGDPLVVQKVVGCLVKGGQHLLTVGRYQQVLPAAFWRRGVPRGVTHRQRHQGRPRRSDACVHGRGAKLDRRQGRRPHRRRPGRRLTQRRLTRTERFISLLLIALCLYRGQGQGRAHGSGCGRRRRVR